MGTKRSKAPKSPFRTMEGWVILAPDGSVELTDFFATKWTTKYDGHAKPKTMETFRRTYRPDCRIVRALLVIPNVPLLKKRR